MVGLTVSNALKLVMRELSEEGIPFGLIESVPTEGEVIRDEGRRIWQYRKGSLLVE